MIGRVEAFDEVGSVCLGGVADAVQQFLDGGILFGSGLEITHHSSSPPFSRTASSTFAASS
ncbi:MAG: hypothetical protein WDN06_06330 [Asticcacaulis sp.]